MCHTKISRLVIIIIITKQSTVIYVEYGGGHAPYFTTRAIYTNSQHRIHKLQTLIIQVSVQSSMLLLVFLKHYELQIHIYAPTQLCQMSWSFANYNYSVTGSDWRRSVPEPFRMSLRRRRRRQCLLSSH